MYITSVTNDYDNVISSNYTDWGNMTQTNCTNNENNTDTIRLTLILTIPCGLLFLCLMSLMVYTLIKPLLNKRWRNFYAQIIQFAVS